MTAADYEKPHEAKEPPPEGPGQPPTNDDRLWALLAHLSILFAGIIGPLVIWLVKKDSSPFVDDQGKEALNFHLTVFIVSMLSVVTCIGPLVVGVGAVVFGILAAVEANKGVYYRYPFTFRLIQ